MTITGPTSHSISKHLTFLVVSAFLVGISSQVGAVVIDPEKYILTNKDRLCERSEPQSYPIVGRALE